MLRAVVFESWAVILCGTTEDFPHFPVQLVYGVVSGFLLLSGSKSRPAAKVWLESRHRSALCKGLIVLSLVCRAVCCFSISLMMLSLSSSQAWAVQYGFGCISNNIGGDCTIGEAQLLIDVTDPGGGQVEFTLTNLGPDASSISDVYFDDGSLLGIATIMNTPTMVEFSLGATPPNLPSANNASPPFVTSSGFSTDSDPPVEPLGVNPGEMLAIIFNLLPLKDFDDVISELNDGTLRVGIHVQGYGTGGSESFVNIVPEPSTGLLLMMGIGLLASRRNASRA
jgi:hypothetical protein